MLKKLLIVLVVFILACTAGVYFYAQSILSSDLVRTRVAAQMAGALGQPVEIGRISATIFPRVTMSLGDVRIGNPARITVDTIDVGTALRALLSRRIANASLHVDGARIELPLPTFAIGAAPDTAAPAGDGDDGPAVTIESIDEVILRNVTVVSGGRTLQGDIEVVPHAGAGGMTIRSMTMALDDTAVDVTGEIASFAGPVGELTIAARTLNMLDLVAFASDFASGATTGAAAAGDTGAPATAAAPPTTAGPRAPMDLNLALTADRAVFGTLALSALDGRARLTADALTFDPVSFGLFDGTYQGGLTLALGATPRVDLRATLANVDMAALTTFAGQPDTLTGRLSGTMQVAASGLSPDAILDSAQGTARVDITQGSVKGLGLVREVVVATSMRADAAAADRAAANEHEPFSRLGATLAISGGAAHTSDLVFESNDVSLTGAGTIGLDGTGIDLTGRVQLSDALSKQSGRDLVRYTQENGRVTVPARITGSAGNLSIRIDVADLMKRAITNKATEEAGEAIRRGLGNLLGR